MIYDPNYLLTVKEFAARLKISLATAYALINERQIRSVRVGSRQGSIRIRERDLEAFLDSGGTKDVQKTSPAFSSHLRLKNLRLD
jgi:excisionase family DNA binding protein